jgi:5-methylcytosine-specific restriction endonuclease McrA
MGQRPRPSDRTPEVAAYQRWYWTPRWRRKSHDQLIAHPFCAYCLRDEGVFTAATISDHVIPHRGNAHLFWHGELQSLCKPHHDGDKRREEQMMQPERCDADGWPV